MNRTHKDRDDLAIEDNINRFKNVTVAGSVIKIIAFQPFF